VPKGLNGFFSPGESLGCCFAIFYLLKEFLLAFLDVKRIGLMETSWGKIGTVVVGGTSVFGLG
jgi:hypothetical protein